MFIKKYTFDDPDLLKKIVHLLGSVEWEKEHDQPLRRYPTKVFYLLEDNGNMVSMFSINKNLLGDFHTEPQHRRNGFFRYLITNQKFNSGVYLMTRSKEVISMFSKIGFVESGKNGRFTKLKKVDDK